MNYKSANTHKDRNKGLIAFGFISTAVAWSLVGLYGFILPPLLGVATYINDKRGNNDPSIYDPVFTTLGGVLFALLLYVIHAIYKIPPV